MNNSENKRIHVTEEEKKELKAKKKSEKENRKSNAQQKIQNNDIPTTSSNENKPNKKIVKAPKIKCKTPTTIDNDSEKKDVDQNIIIQDKGVRSQEKRKHAWFKDLYQPDRRENFIEYFRDNKNINPEFIELGTKIDNGDIQGSTLRCQLFLIATKKLIMDFPVENQESFSRTFGAEFDRHIDFISQCRPLSVTMRTVIKYIKSNLMRMTETDNDKCKSSLVEMIDQFLSERIEAAQKMIVTSVVKLIKAGDRVLVHSYSHLVLESLVVARTELRDKFHVYIATNFHDGEHKKMLDKLKSNDIAHTVVSSHLTIIKHVDLVLFGAYAVLSNNSIVCRSGALSIAIAANRQRIRVVVCAETYKFHALSPSDSIVCNEIADPDALVRDSTTTVDSGCQMDHDWRKNDLVDPVDTRYDLLPHRLVAAICSELGTISPTSASFVTHLRQPVDV